MSNINIKRFVNINIQPHITANAIGIRDTVVLYTADGHSGNVNEFTSIEEVDAYITTLASNESYTTARAYLAMFFANGGIKAKVYDGISYSNLTTTMIKALDNKYIYIACTAETENIEACYAAMKALAIALNGDSTIYGINEKILLASTHNSAIDTDKIKNFAVKYSNVLGAEMTIAAYLSKINIDIADDVQDYAFTEETNIAADTAITDTQYASIVDNNMNVDILLSNIVRNCGGNCKDGNDLVNTFTRIVLQQTLTEKLLSLLVQKIKSSTGISKIYAVIANELERYKYAGYLTTDKIWTDNDLTITGPSGITYTIIQKGDALLNGYVIKVLPTSELTAEDKAAHNTPPIYVILADQYGIRKITINGEVI